MDVQGEVYIPASQAPERPCVGVTFRRIGRSGGHVGVAWCRKPSGGFSALGQEGHLALRSSDLHAEDLLVVVRMARARVRPFIQWANRVARTTRGAVPYGFRYPNAVFDQESGDLLLRQGEGLTCATFVIALFEVGGFPLLDRSTWQPREGDEARFAALFAFVQGAMVQRGGGRLTTDDVVHLAHLKNQVGAIRFRPEEVAASAALCPPPAGFEEACATAGGLLEAWQASMDGTPDGSASPDRVTQPAAPGRYPEGSER